MKKILSYAICMVAMFAIYCGLNLNSVSAMEVKENAETSIVVDENSMTQTSEDVNDVTNEDKHFVGKDEGIMPPVPVTPEIPSEPEVPEIPVEPEKPTPPETPEKPEVPVEPEVPVTPETPEEPEKPVPPVTPEVPDEVEPGEPVVPVEPETPETPEMPDVPETPEKPEVPVVPETPVTPIIPAEPVTPVLPVTPETPIVPEETVNIPQEEFLAGRRPTIVQTGDSSDTNMYIFLMIMSVALLLAIRLYAVKDENLCKETVISTEKSPFMNKMANTIEYKAKNVVFFCKRAGKFALKKITHPFKKE